MAKTNLHQHTVQEKLNSMDIDMIDVTPTIDTSAYAVNDWLFVETEIPNAVSSPGGCSLLQQINIWDFDGDDDSMVIDLLFWSKDPGDGIGAINDDGLAVGAGGLIPADITTYGCHGYARLNSWVKLTDDSNTGADINLAQVASVGSILQADTNSTSVWVTGLLLGGTPTFGNDDDIKLQFGVIKG